MAASQVCGLPGCPVLVAPGPGDTSFCSETHLALFQILEIQHALAAFAVGRPDHVTFEPVSIRDVTGWLPVRRTGSLR